MDQDKLNHVLTAKPHERRVFIEEAAGIARYKQQRNETQGKLDAARQNLVRVRDVMDEVKRQLGSLERQARKAQQYKALQGERRELALSLVAADYAGLTAQAEAFAQELTQLRDGEQGVRAQLSGLAAREARQRELLQASEHKLGDLRQSVQKIQGELERLLERREQMGVQLQELGEECARLEAEVGAERLTGHRATLESARDRAVFDLSTLAAERERLAETLTERAARLADAEQFLAQVRLDLAARSSSRDALRELEVAREGYGAGVRAVFDGATPVLAGVVGTVTDLLEVESGLERAVEAVLGERLQWVVVQRFEHARAAVAWLRDHAKGSATFLPLERLPETNGHGHPNGADLRWVANHI